jgi:large repetitive protein
VGDHNGIIPIQAVNVVLNPPVAGQPATGHVQLVFRQPGPDGVFNTADDIGAALPDDRFTLFVSEDGIIDYAGNRLDGESNAAEPHQQGAFPPILGADGVPTGDGLPGGDFVARFTVDSRPEIGVWAAGSAWIDTNGNGFFDPNNADFTNRDITYMLGLASDHLFAGKFVATGAPNDGNARFDKLGAYGRYHGQFRWLIDTDNDGAPNVEAVDPQQINGLPVAGNFALGFRAKRWACCTGTTWWFDTNHDFMVDTSLAFATPGYPIVGDFRRRRPATTWACSATTRSSSTSARLARRPDQLPRSTMRAARRQRHDRPHVQVRLHRAG